MPILAAPTPVRNLDKAALRGEPSYVWRDGQRRRLSLILESAGERIDKTVLVNGCGVGMYLHHLNDYTENICGLDIEFDRLLEAKTRSDRVVNARGEKLPFPAETFDLILSHEVLEHVQDDRATITEILRSLKPGGRLILFCPNRGYPFETHGFYWRGTYHFGNIPLINYLPRAWRDKLAPHVNIYARRDLSRLFADLPVQFIQQRVIFGAYDNIIARFPRFGKVLRTVLQWLEKTPLRGLGLSHFWVVEKIALE
jgi:SAM-dependent methyltransferase